MAGYEAKSTIVMELFANFVFDMPCYQRPYSWRSKHVYELVQDLLRSYSDQRQDHFIGSIVLVRETDLKETPAYVIDGQQRLTTLLILFAVGRSLFITDPKKKNTMERLLIQDDDGVYFQESRPRLKTNPRQQDFFYKHIIEDLQLKQMKEKLDSGIGVDESCHRFYQSALVMQENLRKAQRSGVDMNEFFVHVAKQCVVMQVVCKTESKAFIIFSTLNGRGMELSVVDKLKADLLRKVQANDREEVLQIWTKHESRLGRDEMAKMFAYLIIESEIRKATKLNKIPDLKLADSRVVFNCFSSLSEEKAKPTVLDLDKMCEALHGFTKRRFKSKDVKQMCRFLKFLPNKQPWLCLVLMFLSKFGKDEEAVAKFLKAVERLALLFHLEAEEQIDPLERWAQVATALQRAIQQKEAAKATFSLRFNNAEEDIFLKRFQGSLLSDVDQTVAKYIMLRLEPGFDWEERFRIADFVLDEVSPRKAPQGSQWAMRKLDGEAHWHPSQRRQAEGALGNLVLLLPGCEVSPGDEFKDKSEVYLKNCGNFDNSKQVFHNTKQVCDMTRFSHSNFESRHYKLIDRACKVWDVKYKPNQAAIKFEKKKREAKQVKEEPKQALGPSAKKQKTKCD